LEPIESTIVVSGRFGEFAATSFRFDAKTLCQHCPAESIQGGETVLLFDGNAKPSAYALQVRDTPIMVVRASDGAAQTITPAPAGTRSRSK
jgi:hypothetical protein